jgi:hypothetical protein
MRDSLDVVLIVREADPILGIPESCQPIKGHDGKPIVYPSQEAAEAVAERHNRRGGLTASTYLRNTRFVAGWIPQEG